MFRSGPDSSLKLEWDGATDAEVEDAQFRNEVTRACKHVRRKMGKAA